MSLFPVVSAYVLLLILSCGSSYSAAISTVQENLIAMQEAEVPAASVDRAEILALLEAASRLKEPYSSNRSYAQQELYDYFDPYLTKNYVDHVVSRNMKQENGRWQVAFPESELEQGTYFDVSFDEETLIEPTREGVTVIHRVEDGLHPAHEEQIQVILTSSGWKINGLLWSPGAHK